METLIIVLIIVVVALAVIALVLIGRARTRAAQAAQPRRTDPFEPAGGTIAGGDPRAIGVGDIVEIRGHSWAVRGQLTMRESSWHWQEYLLEDADGERCWLSVEEDPDLELAVWRPLPGTDLTPGPTTLEVNGTRYRSEEDGSATFQAEGTTGLNDTGTVRYHDYTGPDGALLSFDDYGGSGHWEVSTGQVVPRHELRVLPAL